MITALIAVVGGHWAVLQTVAWTAMLANNLRTDSLETALTKTFDGEHPCKLCKVISAGKKAEKKSEAPATARKLEFVSDRSALVFCPPQDFWLQAELFPSSTTLTHAPPLPPPRLRAA